MVLVNNDKNFVFIQIPKTGSSSIGYALGQRQNPEPELHHQTLSNIIKNIPELNKYFIFTFIRNPWDRLLSLWCDFTQIRKKEYSEKITLDNELFSEFNSFEDFCINFRNTIWINDVFLKPQLYFIFPYSRINFIGKYESLNEDYKKLCHILNITHDKLPIIRKTEHNHYRNYYTQQTRDIIAEIYKEDIKEFGYEF